MEKETLPKGKIVIYTSADGKISLDTKLEKLLYILVLMVKYHLIPNWKMKQFGLRRI